MNIDHMIKMANEISAFWEGEAGPDTAAKEVATHLRRFWEPRMRAQMIEYFHKRQGSGLCDVAKHAVALLEKESAKPASLADKVAPAADFTLTPNAADPHGGDAG